MSVFSVIVNLLPYVIAAIIAVFFVINRKKTRKDNWLFSLFPLCFIIIIPLVCISSVKSRNIWDNIPSLCLLLLGYLILDFSFFISLPAVEYNENFNVSITLSIAGMFVISGTILAKGNDIGIIVIVILLLAICLCIAIGSIYIDFKDRYIHHSAVIFAAGSESIVIEYRDYDGKLQWAVIDTQEKYSAGDKIYICIDNWKHIVTLSKK